jgi:streptogramin lyase
VTGQLRHDGSANSQPPASWMTAARRFPPQLGGARRLTAMRRVLSRTVIAVVALSGALGGGWASRAAAAPAVNGIFPVAGVATNNKIVAGPEGNIWVTLSEPAKNVARLTPGGEVKEYELGLNNASGIAVGPEGKIWVTEPEGVASFSPSNPEGSVEKTKIPTIKNFQSIVAGPDGKMWVATEEEVLRFAPSAPATQETKSIPGLSPRDIDVSGPLIVIADGGSPRIVTLTSNLQEKDYPIAEEGASQGVAGSPSGQIAFSYSGSASTPEQIGLISPPNPAKSSELLGDPFGVAFGSDDAFWIVQFAKGGLTRLTSSGQKTFLGGLPVESARQIAPGPNNTLWVTLTQMEHEGVARISGLEPPAPPAPVNPVKPAPPVPETKILKGPKSKVKTALKRAKVAFKFSSSVLDSSFECALTTVRKGKKARAPRFSSCKSPKHLKLKAGKYRFWVRALSAGAVDPSPATQSFRIIPIRR